MDDPDSPPARPPPPPPPKRLSRPKITLQIPDSSTPITPKTARGPPGPMYWPPPGFPGKPPGTAATHMSDPHGNPYFNPFMHMYHNKASDFMFKQFEGFKDFTMTTAKSGLSIGEKSAFWIYNKLRLWSKKWFTHLFLTLCLALYSVMGAAIFVALEGGAHETKYEMNITEIRRDYAVKVENIWKNRTVTENETLLLSRLEDVFQKYEVNYTECTKVSCYGVSKNSTWGFMNAMFYAGTIYTTIG